MLLLFCLLHFLFPASSGPKQDKHGKCHFGKCLCFTGFVGTGCETKHFQGYAMVFRDDSHLRVQPLGKEKSFTFEAWIRLASLPEPGKKMKLFRAGKTVSLDIISHGRISFSVQGNLPETVVFDTKPAMLKRLVWYVGTCKALEVCLPKIFCFIEY